MKDGSPEYYAFKHSCWFIRKEMQYYSFEDFVKDARALKRLYMCCDDLTKELYKYYVYSRFMSYSRKCMIWDYLNNNRSFKKLTKRS